MKMKKILLASFLLLFLNINSAQAALVKCGGVGQKACEFCDFFVLINDLVRFVMLTLVPIAAVLMLVIGGAMLVVGGGVKADTWGKAKGIITSVVVGLLIIFSAWVIVNTVLTKSGIVKSPSLLQWHQIGCQ